MGRKTVRMNKAFGLLFILIFNITFSQEKLIPLTTNPYISKKSPVQTKNSHNIDSTFQSFTYGNINLPVWDDFSINKFVDYNLGYTDANVTSILYYQLMNSGNTTALSSSIQLCDSTHARTDTVVIENGIELSRGTSYFTTGIPVFVNDLNSYPVNGQTKTLYNECYVLIDSIIEGVPDPTQDTLWFIGQHPDSLPDFTQDSARVFFGNMNNPNNIWIDDYACHNYRYAKNPKSLGVVTFDGVSNDGYPYEWGSANSYGYADVLTSKPINLSGKTNVYLTFLYQAKGYGNSPETFDSLFLEFYDPNADKWFNVGGITNGFGVDGDVADDVWYTAHVPITQSVLLVDGFQFRFRNKATLTGLLDHWHIDYVNLRDNSTDADTIIDDIAIVEPLNSFLIDYSAVPWDHYSNLSNPNSVMLSSADLTVSNNHTSAKLQNNGGLLIDGNSFSLPVANANWNVGLNPYSFGVNTQPYVFPQTFPGDTMASFNVKINVATSSTNIYDVNDTTYFNQEFKNFYAYDDGTAETAYGFEVYNARLAYKFDTYEADSLAGILMKFIPSNEDISNNIFLLTIWADDNGQPGEIIYQDSYFQPHTPNYAGNKNQYQYYKFNNNEFVSVPKTFYVGWEQVENEMLYIGMDLNHDHSDKIFYNIGGGWVNTSFQGSLIIRPVFSTKLNSTLTTKENNDEDLDLSIYPNPSQDFITVNGISNTDRIEIRDLSGRIVLSDTGNRFDIQNFANGIYIVSIYNSQNKRIYSDKIMKY